MMSTFKKSGNIVFFTLLVIGIVFFINLLASRFYTRIDLTSDGSYTISSASKDLAAKLPDHMGIKAFISKELPPTFENHVRHLVDMLEDFASSSANIDLEVIRIAAEDEDAIR